MLASSLFTSCFTSHLHSMIHFLKGFVRFAHPKSVDRAFDRFKVSEIEVQDVSVMMKPLKPDYQTAL